MLVFERSFFLKIWHARSEKHARYLNDVIIRVKGTQYFSFIVLDTFIFPSSWSRAHPRRQDRLPRLDIATMQLPSVHLTFCRGLYARAQPREPNAPGGFPNSHAATNHTQLVNPQGHGLLSMSEAQDTWNVPGTKRFEATCLDRVSPRGRYSEDFHSFSINKAPSSPASLQANNGSPGFKFREDVKMQIWSNCVYPPGSRRRAMTIWIPTLRFVVPKHYCFEFQHL